MARTRRHLRECELTCFGSCSNSSLGDITARKKPCMATSNGKAATKFRRKARCTWGDPRRTLCWNNPHESVGQQAARGLHRVG
ncbi:MAG: hypothetical protein AABZ47_07980 [Planctomycetota bacterium]